MTTEAAIAVQLYYRLPPPGPPPPGVMRSGGNVVLAESNDAGGSLSSSGGGVRVAIEPGARLSIDASSSGGSVHCDLPVQRLGKESRTTLRGDLNGGGSVLKLRSSGGGIHIDASGG